LIQSLLDVYYVYSLCENPSRLLSGTTSVLLDPLDDALENPGVRPLPRKEEICILWIPIMSKATKTPLRNYQRPVRLFG
jgi:hypothetical protein